MKTPQQNHSALAIALGLNEIWLKREDLHHFGSHKGRSIPLMMDYYWHKEKKNSFVISSSGNAALAAALYVKHHNANNPDSPIDLLIFIGQHIEEVKLRKILAIQDARIATQQVNNPKQSAFQAEKNGAVFLRQSTDDLALKGYYELAEELHHIPNLQAVFIPTSSGTTAQALAEYFSKDGQKPEIHIVQTSAVHPIAESFNNPLCPVFACSPQESPSSIAGAIVDKTAYRKFVVVNAVLKSGGTGWIATDDDIRRAIEFVQKTTGIAISPNSALSIAGLMLALKAGKKYQGAVVCLITGE